MYDRPAVNVGETVCDLLEDELRVRFLQLALPLDEPQEVTTARVLHDHEEMLA